MRYSTSEVRAIVEGYEELKANADTWGPGLHSLLCLADLRRALVEMPEDLRRAVLVHGQYRHTIRDAATLLGETKWSAFELYHEGLSWIVRFLNGDDQ